MIITTKTLHLGKTHSTPHEGFILLDMFLEKGSKCQLLDSDGFEYTKLNFEYLIG